MSDSSRDSPEVAGGAKDGPPGPEVHPGGSSTAHADSALPQESGTAVVITPSCSQTASPPYSNVKEKGSGNQPVCQPPRPTGSRILPPKVRIGSTSSVCTKSSKKSQSSYKSAACQIQEVAGDDVCATLLLTCLFCQFYDCLLLVPSACGLCAHTICASFCACFCEPLPTECCEGCSEALPEVLNGFCDNMHCSCCVDCDCSIMEACQQTSECLELALEISELCYH
ncbi:myoD family inhibitor-like isoform X3 [Ambystoma mexicanum]|uniref:myoD family inhibitor-like isoform X3 n=1 Tax=Ambystoma mexicanum TaxID=8296 RepID=UPI0037E918CB